MLFSKAVDQINEWIGRGVGWVTAGLVAVVFVDVVMRYAFNTSFVFTQELEWHLFAFIFLIPGCAMVIITSWKFVYNAWRIMEGSPDPGGIPYRFLIKGAIPVGFGLLVLQGLSLGIKSLQTILDKKPPNKETD